jgi:hypothetical protein
VKKQLRGDQHHVSQAGVIGIKRDGKERRWWLLLLLLLWIEKESRGMGVDECGLS